MHRLPLLLFASLYSVMLSAQVVSSGLQLLGHLPYDTATLAGCWHHVDSTGGEYALVGTSKGLSIVDLSDPTNPVQRFFVPGATNNWREVKTWGGFAYVGSEAINSGITIVDLRSLPDTVTWKVWTGNGPYNGLIIQSHTVAATDGYLYVFGGGLLSTGVIVCSLADPWNPVVKGWFPKPPGSSGPIYFHDGYIRNDTLWASAIYDGLFAVIDVSDKTNLKLLATNPTPGAFNHNSWLSDDGRTLFTTDEKPDSPLASFDISDLENITLLDVYYPSQNPSREVHNVRVLDDFLINPSYGGQLTIVDARHPDNLIETAWAILGNSLVWDADPYLPSGIIMATAKNEGLFIFATDYIRAAYLEGLVTDAGTGLPLNGARVFIDVTANADTTNFAGLYKTGVAQEGYYSIIVEKDGYQTAIINGVELLSGQTKVLNIALQPALVSAKNIERKTLVSAAPTLFNDRITVDVPPTSVFAEPGTTIRIFDMNGRLLQETPATGARTAVFANSGLPSGQYVLVLQNKGRLSKAIQVVKQ